MRRLVVLSFLLMPAAPADAYDSLACGSGVFDCEGLEAARTPWVHSEHAQIWQRTRVRAGLPAAIDSRFTVRTPLNGMTVEDFPSFHAVPLDQITAFQDRQIEIAVFAQLPDKSYALWDWVGGNEGCPPTNGGFFEECHAFESHMGWLNSNHFLPQAELTFFHYHSLALERARECADMKARLDDAQRDGEDILEECDRQALMLEAIAHHFLQDAWSMGHMWQRWGSTELADFEAARGRVEDTPSLKAIGDAVGRGSGIIHGAKAVTHLADAMCLPDEGIELVHEGMTLAGAGDLFLERLESEARLEAQRERLYDCAATAMREIYLASARSLGEPEPSMQRTVALNTCFTQRATNRAMALGAAIQIPRSLVAGMEPMIVAIAGGILGTVEVLLLAHLEHASASYLGAFEAEPLVRGDLYLPLTAELLTSMTFGQVVGDEVLTAWHNDMARIHGELVRFAVGRAGGTELARGEMGPLLGMRQNADYAAVAGYLDPHPPWAPMAHAMPEQPRHVLAGDFLARTFAQAHTKDWCEVMTESGEGELSLSVLRARCRDEELPEAERDVACSVCELRAAPHLRQVDAMGVPVKEALCVVLGVDDADVIDISPTDDPFPEDAWCRQACSKGDTLEVPLLGTMMCIPPGTYVQGCLPGRDDLFEPCTEGTAVTREVTISRAFWMMEKEMNADLFVQAMFPVEHSCEPGVPLSDCPAINVRYAVAVAVADALSQATMLPSCGAGATPSCDGWRLPTEAEWEWAARGGEAFVFPGSDNADDVASVPGADLLPASCSKARNAFGLCDMSGSVREWVLDGIDVDASIEQVVAAGYNNEGIATYTSTVAVTDPITFGPSFIEGIEIRAARGGAPFRAMRSAERDFGFTSVEVQLTSGASVESPFMGFRLVVNAQ